MTVMPTALYVYRARCERVIDGDTIDATISMGLHDYRTERLRLLGVNAPERKGETRAAGDAARLFVVEWMRGGVALDEWPLVIRTQKSDAFGRFLGTVWRVSDGVSLNEALLAAGMAVPFRGGAAV